MERISDEEIITVEKISSAMGVIYERDKPLLAEPGKFEEIPITKTDVSKYDELIRRREI